MLVLRRQTHRGVADYPLLSDCCPVIILCHQLVHRVLRLFSRLEWLGALVTRTALDCTRQELIGTRTRSSSLAL